MQYDKVHVIAETIEDYVPQIIQTFGGCDFVKRNNSSISVNMASLSARIYPTKIELMGSFDKLENDISGIEATAIPITTIQNVAGYLGVDDSILLAGSVTYLEVGKTILEPAYIDENGEIHPLTSSEIISTINGHSKLNKYADYYTNNEYSGKYFISGKKKNPKSKPDKTLIIYDKRAEILSCEGIDKGKELLRLEVRYRRPYRQLGGLISTLKDLTDNYKAYKVAEIATNDFRAIQYMEAITLNETAEILPNESDRLLLCYIKQVGINQYRKDIAELAEQGRISQPTKARRIKEANRVLQAYEASTQGGEIEAVVRAGVEQMKNDLQKTLTPAEIDEINREKEAIKWAKNEQSRRRQKT